MTQVRCPACGYLMPVFYTDGASCKGVFIVCKGRGCKAVFELKIKQGKQIN
ncbi:MAG: hypothetical protein LUD72_10375 [Bacteroidales bacterium]|nr:hypothetical protein [Bacteroidales bacterium]